MKSSIEEVTTRRDRLAGLLMREGYLSVASLAERFEISEATVRRDLSALEKENRITRTYGGALSEYDALFMPFFQRNAQNREVKSSIAHTAVQHVKGGQTIFLDAGSTVYAVAERLTNEEFEGLVVTNSLPVAEVLASRGSADVHLLGGRLLPHQLVVAGSGSSVSLARWQFDIAMLSAEGMDQSGLWNSQDEISDFQRHVCGRSREAIFCVDDSKLGRKAPSFLMGWTDVDRLITNASGQELLLHGAGLRPGQLIPVVCSHQLRVD